MKRRDFISTTIAGATALTAGALASAQSSPEPAAKPAPATTPTTPEPFDAATVKEFVIAGHGNLARVKEMLEAQPRLVFASHDWGDGDFETALGGASHVGQRELALRLLDAGARIDAFCAAMLGKTDFIRSLLLFNPTAANTRGPHGYTLLYHAGYSGDVDLLREIGGHITENRPRHFNQALQSAVARNHANLVGWLLENGVDDPNVPFFNGKTPLDVAIEKKSDEIIILLRSSGAVAGSG